MRNLYDQYDQPENKLTHALVSTLANDRKLLRPFLRWLEAERIPPLKALHIVEQQVPGVRTSGDEAESRGLPDACIHDAEGWAVLIEAKVQAGISVGQLRRHKATAERHGFEDLHLCLIAVDLPKRELPLGVRRVEWRELYEWFGRWTNRSTWARKFVEYMQVFEAKMLSQAYDIRGTLTMFDGLRFNDDNPYTYREGKRLIRLLGDELQQRKDLVKLGVDPKGQRRSAITGRNDDRVWDFIPLKVARKAKQFTDFPHLTMGVFRNEAIAAVTIPNGVKGGFRTKLKAGEIKDFRELLRQVEAGLRPIVRQSKGARPMVYATQRHYRGQRSLPEVDARLDADLRTIAGCAKSLIKPQPEWIEAIFRVLVSKRSNVQFGVEVHFQYDCPVVRSPRAVDLCAESWRAMWPIVEFVLQG